MEHPKVMVKPAYKIYSDSAVTLGTFLGGPLAAGYMMAANFKAFNEPEKVKATWSYAFFCYILIFVLFFSSFGFEIPPYLVPLTYVLLAYFFVKRFQKNNIDAHVDAAGELFNWWKVVRIILLCFFITIVVMIIVVLFLDVVRRLPPAV